MKLREACLAALFGLSLTLLAPGCSPAGDGSGPPDVFGATVDAPDGLAIVDDELNASGIEIPFDQIVVHQAT